MSVQSAAGHFTKKPIVEDMRLAVDGRKKPKNVTNVEWHSSARDTYGTTLGLCTKLQRNICATRVVRRLSTSSR